MRRKRQDFAKHLVTTLVVVGVMVAFSFQATLSGEEKDKKHLLQLAPQKKGEYALGEDNIMYLYNGREWEEVEGKRHKFIKAYNGMFHYNGKEWKKIDTKPSTKGFRIGIGLNGGWNSWGLGDFGLSKEYFENLNSIPGYSASTNDLSGSPFGGFDLILAYNFPRNHSIGLSAGFRYCPGGTFEQNWTYQDTTSTSKLDLSTVVIPVELFYKHPLGKCFFLKLAGGVDFYHTTIDYDSSFRMSGEDYFYRGKLKDKKIGSHVSLGVEYSLNKNLALSVNAGYSFAKPNNFTGTLVGRDGAGTEMLLTMARDEFGEMLSIYPTTEPLPPDYRPAEIDLKGLEIAIRITITISWKKIGILIESI